MFSFIRKIKTGNKYGIPSDVVQSLRQNPHQFTPDIAELHARKHNLVFIYGNEMSTGRAALPMGCLPYTDVFTVDPFVMIKTQENQKVYPAVIDPPKDAMGRIWKTKAPVKGELYQLTDEEVAQLDTEYQNGVMFQRRRVALRIEHYVISKHEHATIHGGGIVPEHRVSEPMYHEKRAWAYFGNFDFFNYVKISRDSFKLLKDRDLNPEYEPRYYYSPEDWR